MNEKKRNDLKYFTGIGIVIQFGVVVISNILVAAVIGYYLDRWTFKNKLFLIIFLFLGVASGLYQGIRYLMKEAKRYENRDKFSK
ncbi:MAG: synthase protein [Thermotogaceae bacterium]|jgi:F0F1-type ATP synthase assembly protein I|nr:synthase protein [Thermotogaceae bacterium]MDN5338707.1 synthase protein [Thermotogaceae bacterium]